MWHSEREIDPELVHTLWPLLFLQGENHQGSAALWHLRLRATMPVLLKAIVGAPAMSIAAFTSFCCLCHVVLQPLVIGSCLPSWRTIIRWSGIFTSSVVVHICFVFLDISDIAQRSPKSSYHVLSKYGWLTWAKYLLPSFFATNEVTTQTFILYMLWFTPKCGF